MFQLKKVSILAITISVMYSLTVSAQDNLQLSDWGVLDPWESTCQETALDRTREKLYENIASKAFTWMTGTREQAHYEPIGELANYFGFARLRNEIRDAADDPLADQNLRGTSWLVVLEHLDQAQRTILYDSAKEQETAFFGFIKDRVELIDMLYGLKEGNHINLSNATQPIESMGIYEAEVSIISAEAFGEVSLTLTSDQKELFTNIRQGNLRVVDLKGIGPYASMVSSELEGWTPRQEELIKETASKFLSYETGSLEDAIFLPQGKIGNYFGFASYRYEERTSVSRKQAADLLLSVLSDSQKELLKCLTTQVYDFEQTYIAARAALITDAYPLKSGIEIDESSLINNYLLGAIAEGKMGVVLAIYFDYLERLLNEDQINKLNTYRADTGVTSVNSVEQLGIEIGHPYPNPFKDHITINYQLNQPIHVVLQIYNMQGHQIAELVNSYQSPGDYNIDWNAKNHTSGSYICIFQFGDDRSLMRQAIRRFQIE